MPPKGHATLSASASAIWLNCPPAIRLSEKLAKRIGEDGKEKDTAYTLEGTKAHELAEIKLRLAKGEFTEQVFNARREALGEIPGDMEDATDTYVDVILEKWNDAKRDCPDAELLLETRIDYSKWAPHGFGTSDAVIVSDQILEVCDYKHGKGVEVSAVNNPQARLYGLGATNLFSPLYSFRRVRNTIIQPRIDNISTEELTTEELLRWGDEIVKPNARLAWRGKGEFNPGEHCRWCGCKAVCRARAAQSLTIFETGLEDPPLLTDKQILALLKYIPTAEAWCKEIQEYAYNQALKGQIWPGYKLVNGRGSRSWVDKDQALQTLREAGYKDDQLFKPAEMLSVAQIETAIGKKNFKAVVGDQVQSLPGKLTLVPEDDKRQATDCAAVDFADLVTTT